MVRAIPARYPMTMARSRQLTVGWLATARDTRAIPDDHGAQPPAHGRMAGDCRSPGEVGLGSPSTSSFAFLAPYGPLYLRLATTAERSLAVDPSLTLVSLRQLSEAFARHAAARAGLLTDKRDSSAKQLDLLHVLEQRGIVRDQIAEIFHMLRRVGNRAAHDFVGTH